MPEGFTFFDLQMLVSIKLVFFAFVVLGIFGMYRKYTPVYFVSLIGILGSLAYYLFVKDIGMMFWGLIGDEITLAAMYYKFAHVSMLADFSYSHLPAFYPPLFFWIGGLFGRLMDWNGIQIAKFMTMMSFLIYPFILYFVQKLHWVHTSHISHIPGPVAWLVSVFLIFGVFDADALITKPYEVMSASLIALWTVYLLYDVYHGNLTKKHIAIYGVTGGILFLLFYFWFFLAAIGVGIFHVFTKFKKRIHAWGFYLLIGIITLAIASPFWFPLAQSYTQLGSENWQAGYFLITGISSQGIDIAFAIPALVTLFGFATLLIYRKNIYVRALLSLFTAAYVWQIMGMVTLLVWASPIQESKGFFFWGTSILILAAAYGIERLWHWIKKDHTYKKWRLAIKMFALVLISTQMIFGSFADDPVAQATRVQSRTPRAGVAELVEYLQTQDTKDTITLHSGITELYAFVPMNDFIYFNMNNSPVKQ